MFKACTSNTARSVAVPPKSIVSMVRSASSNSMVESRLDSIHKKRKREGKGSEACRGVLKTTEAIVVRIRKNPSRSVKGLKFVKEASEDEDG